MKLVKFLPALLFSFLCITTVATAAEIDGPHKTELTILNDTNSDVYIQWMGPGETTPENRVIYNHQDLNLIADYTEWSEISVKLSDWTGVFFDQKIPNHTILKVSDYIGFSHKK